MSNLTDIIDRLKTDPKHEKSLARLRAFCKDDHGQDLACIPPDGLDAAKIATAKEKLEEVGATRAVRGAYKDYLTFDEWQAKGKGKAPPCDPSIGILDGQQVPLIDGISQDTAGIDWSAVPSDRLVLVLHGRESGVLEKTPGPSLRRQWARELATGEAGDWAPIRKEYDGLRSSEKERLADMLAYKRPAKVLPDMPRREPPFPGPGGSSISVGGSMTGCAVVSGNGNTVSGPMSPAALAQPQPDEVAWIREMINHCTSELKAKWVPGGLGYVSIDYPALRTPQPKRGMGLVNQAIIQHFAAAGWRVTPKHDQRDGDWLEFQPAG